MQIVLYFMLFFITSASDVPVIDSLTENVSIFMTENGLDQNATEKPEFETQITTNTEEYTNKADNSPLETTHNVSETVPTTNIETQIESELSNNETIPVRQKISETIISILNHYKQPDPLGLPGVPVPDPMSIPDMKQSFSIGTMYFNHVLLRGLSKYRIEHIVANVTVMTVEVCLSIDVLTLTGDYILQTWISKASGPFTVKVKNVTVIITTSLEVGANGTLEAQNLDTDVTFSNIDMDFEGLGFVAHMFQGIMNSVGSFLFDSIKPYILCEVNTNIRQEINNEIKKINKIFPTTVSPVDQLISEIRNSLRYRGYEPYHVPDYNNKAGMFEIRLSHTWLSGLTNFYRTKDIILEMRKKIVHTSFEVSTGKLLGTSNWEVALVPGRLYRDGSLAFTVNYFKIRIDASQSLNTSHPPSLDDIQLEFGDIHVKFNGLGSMDNLIEIGVNIIPNLLRHQIMDAVERPIKFKIQEVLNLVNIESLVVDNADQLDFGTEV